MIKTPLAEPVSPSSEPSGQTQSEGPTLRVNVNDNPFRSNPDWFALFVRPRHERSVASLLEYQNLERFVPSYLARRKWSDRIRESELPLFPGYVFCRFRRELLRSVERTPGVIRTVAFAGMPTPIPDQEIESIKMIVASRLRAEPWPALHLGQHVIMEAGPLAGIQGTVSSFNNNHRLVVAVDLLNRSVAVEIDLAWARPLSCSKAMGPLMSTTPAVRRADGQRQR